MEVKNALLALFYSFTVLLTYKYWWEKLLPYPARGCKKQLCSKQDTNSLTVKNALFLLLNKHINYLRVCLSLCKETLLTISSLGLSQYCRTLRDAQTGRCQLVPRFQPNSDIQAQIITLKCTGCYFRQQG